MGETVVSKVPCSVAIRTAQAMVQEVPEAAHSSISSLAQCGESHSERDTHRLANRFRLSVNIPISTMKVGEVLMPYLKMSHWAQFLISQGLWHHLAGLKQRDPERTAAIWRTFWDRYRCINPNHEIYKRTGLDLGSVCALMIHGDEGRSQKKAPIMVLAAHSILGFGLSTSKVPKDEYLSMKLNYESPTWTTRFLLAVAPRHFYADNDDHMQNMMNAISLDLQSLYNDGVPTLDGNQVYFCPLALMGDWPFVAKAGALSRSFLNISKHANARSAPKGICHRCQADRVGWEWENFEPETPTWLQSENTLSPYVVEPAVLMLPMNRENTPKWFAWDLFHAWHLGAGKSFMASAFVLLCMSALYFGSIDSRIEACSSDFFCMVQRHQKATIHSEVNKGNAGLAANLKLPLWWMEQRIDNYSSHEFFFCGCVTEIPQLLKRMPC